MALGHWLKDYIGPHSGGSGGSGGGEIDPGYSCTETTTLLTDESVTTSKPEGLPVEVYTGQLSIEDINAPSIRVTFNGTPYICERVNASYGAPGEPDSKDWSQYPFSIIRDGMVQTESAGTYQIKIEVTNETVETSECFKKAVISISSLIVTTNSTLDDKVMSETWQTIHDALAKGVHVVLVGESGVYTITSAIVAGDTYLVLVADYYDDAPMVKKYIATSADSYPSMNSDIDLQ